MIQLIIHTGIAAGVGRAFSRVCLLVCLIVRTLTGKRLELSTPNLVHVYSIAVVRHALNHRSKGQRSRLHGYENRHGRTVASDRRQYSAVLPCGRCRRGSACRYDCLCFLVISVTFLQCVVTAGRAIHPVCRQTCSTHCSGSFPIKSAVASSGFGARRGTCKCYWVLQEATVDSRCQTSYGSKCI